MRANDIPKDRKDYACLSAVPDARIKKMYVSVFDIPLSNWPALLDREFEYRLVNIPFKELKTGKKGEGVVCMGDYDNDFECEQITASDPIRFKRWKEFKDKYQGPMWRCDLEPCPTYLSRCIETIKSKQPEFLDNFLDTTFTGDERSIREYLNP